MVAALQSQHLLGDMDRTARRFPPLAQSTQRPVLQNRLRVKRENRAIWDEIDETTRSRTSVSS